METTSVQNYLSVMYREDLDVLFVRWTSSLPQALPAHDGYQAALDIATQKDARFWLVDLRGRSLHTAQDEDWSHNNFSASIRSKTHSRNFFAYLISPAHLQAMEERLGPILEFEANAALSIRYFTSENEALSWLQAQQLLNRN